MRRLRLPQNWGRGGRSLSSTLWLLCGLAFCLLSSYAPSRYYVLFLPPLAGLAALGMARLRPSWSSRRRCLVSD